MKRQTVRVPLICLSAIVLFLDLSLVIDLLNLGKPDFTGMQIFICCFVNLLAVALWVLYFVKLPPITKNGSH